MNRIAVRCLLGGLAVLGTTSLVGCKKKQPTPPAMIDGGTSRPDANRPADAPGSAPRDYADGDLGTDGGLSDRDDSGVASGANYSVQCRFGDYRRWGNPAEGKRIIVKLGRVGSPDIEGEKEWDAVIAALRTWASVGCSNLDFEIQSERLEREEMRHDNDQELRILFNGHDFTWTSEPNATMSSVIYQDEGESRIRYASIRVNTSPGRVWRWSTADGGEANKIDLQSALTVTIGEALGVGTHNAGTDSIMLPDEDGGKFTVNDTSRRTLGSGDRAAIQHLYPATPACDGLPDPVSACCNFFDEAERLSDCSECEASRNSVACD